MLARVSSQSNLMYSALVFSFLRSLVVKGILAAKTMEISSISLDMWVGCTCTLQNYFVYFVPYTYKYTILWWNYKQAWKLYEEERWGELIDSSLDTINHSEEMMRCMNIALLCVQEKAADRPTMLDVVAMLSNKSMVLVKPKHPAYFNLSSVGNEEASIATQPSSINNVTISVTTGR